MIVVPAVQLLSNAVSVNWLSIDEHSISERNTQTPQMVLTISAAADTVFLSSVCACVCEATNHHSKQDELDLHISQTLSCVFDGSDRHLPPLMESLNIQLC